MKIGEIVNYRGVSGEIIGETTSLFQERKKVYFVRLENGNVVEPYEEDLKGIKAMVCGICSHFIPKGSHGTCVLKKKTKYRGVSVMYSDPSCVKFILKQ